ncbi:hypothetical protein LguiA_005990 [Lonicera macranthoides]
MVANTSFYDYAKDEARGMAIKARIAAYKICWNSGCYSPNILVAMDQAIDDGVHHSVFVSRLAKNSGIDPYTSVNIALWIITVNDSTVDKEFLAYVIIRDGRIFGGVLLYFGDPLRESKLPLVYAEDCGSKYCYSGMLNSSPTATIVFK